MVAGLAAEYVKVVFIDVGGLEVSLLGLNIDFLQYLGLLLIKPMDPAPSSFDNGLHAIADPTRRRILDALKQHNRSSTEKNAGMCAGDIEQCIRLSQPTVSHHMAILTKAGLVDAIKQGQWRWYRRNEKALRRLVKSLRAQL